MAAERVWGKDHEVVAFCEIDPFCQAVLKKNFKGVYVHGDIRTLTKATAFDMIVPCANDQKNILKQLACMTAECLSEIWLDITALVDRQCTKSLNDEAQDLEKIFDTGKKTTFIGEREPAIGRKICLKKHVRKGLSKKRVIANIAVTLDRSKMDDQKYRRIIQIIQSHLMLSGSVKSATMNGIEQTGRQEASNEATAGRINPDTTRKRYGKARESVEQQTQRTPRIDLLTGGFP